MKMSFSSFNLESHSSCSYDYVELRDGIGSGSSLLGKFCGSSTPPEKTAESGTMQITFKSDGSNSKSGFRASLTPVPITITGG